MSYGGDYGGYGPPRQPRQQPRGPRQHQPAQMMPLPGRDQGLRSPGREPDYARPGGYQPPPPQHRPPARPPMRPKRKRWTVGRVLLSLLLVFVLFIAGVWIYLEFSINRVDALRDYPGRPAAASGTNWLIVGSDSRNGIDEEEAKKLSTGDTDAAGGKRTDTIMVAHIPDNSTKATLLSLPRDLMVKIPGHGTGQINSAFSDDSFNDGGPHLLQKTVESLTGLRIDHYAEIGFGGFANIVDAIGGVEMDIPTEMNDPMTGVKIPAGKQELDGAQALGFVRMRYSEATPRSDLDRVANQRKFIGAMVSEMASPGTLLNPFHLFPLLSTAPDALTMDDEDHLHNLVGLAWAMRGISSGEVVTTTLPVTDPSAKSVDQKKANALFDALRTDKAIPDSSIVN